MAFFLGLSMIAIIGKRERERDGGHDGILPRVVHDYNHW